MNKPDRAARLAEKIFRDVCYGHADAELRGDAPEYVKAIAQALRTHGDERLEEAAGKARNLKHINVPEKGGDELDRVARYSNNTCELIAVDILALKKSPRVGG